MHFTTAAVDRYGPLADCRPPCSDGLTVFSGPNEAGKTLYLEAILQLLEPTVSEVMHPEPRVGHAPTGRVVLDVGGEQYVCDGERSISDATPIQPAHLSTIFVVRDSDLQLPTDRDYYTSLIETLGNIHTSEIEAIETALRDRGRLTEQRLDISSDQRHNNAGDVSEQAAALATEIREYAARVETEGIDDLDATRLRTRQALQDAIERRDRQRQAKTIAEYDRLAAHLETYRTTSERLEELSQFDRETLDKLRALDRKIDRERGALAELDADIESAQRAVDQAAEELTTAEDALQDFERRADAVEDARAALDRHRDHRLDASSAQRRLTLAKYGVVAGVLAAGVAGAAGALTGSSLAIGLGAVCLLVAFGSAYGHRRADQQLSAVETTRETAIETALDAGLEVSEISDIAPAIDAFDSSRTQARDRVTRADEQHKNATDRLERLEQERADRADAVSDAEGQLEELLEETSVDSIEAYETRVERRESIEPDHETARRTLTDRFGTPESDSPAAIADAWETALDATLTGVDRAAVDAELYDEATLSRHQRAVGHLRAALEKRQAELDGFDAKLDEFDERVRDLPTTPFIDQSLALPTRSVAGLRSLANGLDSLVEAIETDAEVSRKAIELFEQIKRDEEQKLAELFAHDGPASETFERITGGRYTAVRYDPEPHAIEVERHDGATFDPGILSRGTTDQLYFATRVSLATQLLGSEPGFFLLDDPFVGADPDRLRRGFETLQNLAKDGWQILYFTAKQEVYTDMVDEYGLTCVDLDAGGLV